MYKLDFIKCCCVIKCVNDTGSVKQQLVLCLLACLLACLINGVLNYGVLYVVSCRHAGPLRFTLRVCLYVCVCACMYVFVLFFWSRKRWRKRA